MTERGILYLDLHDHFRKHVAPGKESDIYWPIDKHFNAKGYEILAMGVADALPEIPGFVAKTRAIGGD